MNELGYNKALARVKQRQQREARLAEWLREHQKRVNQVWRLACECSGSASIDSQAAYNDADKHQVIVSITLQGLQGLKDPALEKAITPWLDADETECKDYPQYLNRDYIFKYKLPGGAIHVTVCAYVASENPTCRKILVERRVTPRVEEVYKLSCDGDIIDADPVLPKVGNDPLTLENEA